MEYKVKKNSDTEMDILICIKEETVENSLTERINKLRSTISLSGFRLGKVPISIIKKKYETSIKNDILAKILENSIKNIIKLENIKPINSPNVSRITSDKEYTFLAKFITFPPIKIKKLSFNLDKIEVKIDDSDIDKIIENLRYEMGSWEKVTRKSRIGDKVEIEYTLYSDDKERENNKKKKEEIILKNTNILTCSGKRIDVKLLDYPDNNEINLKSEDILSKKICNIEFRINNISEIKKLYSNEEIAKVIKCDSNSISDIKEKIKVNTSIQIDEITEKDLKNQCLDKLYEENKIDIPDALLSNKIDNKAGIKKKEEEIQALRKKITIELLIKEIIKIEKISIKKVEIQDRLNKIYSINPDLKSDDIKENLIKNVKNELLIDNVISFIKDKSTFNKININLEDFLRKYNI